MTNLKKQLGEQGERLATDFLLRNGYLVLNKNYYTQGGEIDVIAQDKDKNEIVFVEVKTRTSNKFGWPEQAVDDNKKQHLQKAAQKYLVENKHTAYQNYRFDIISVEMNQMTGEHQIKHFKYI